MHDYRKDHNLDYMDLISKVMSLLFTVLSRFVIAFLPRSYCLLILDPRSGGAEGSSRKYPQRPEASQGPEAGRRRGALLGDHDDFYDDAIVVQNYSYIFKLHPEGRIHSISL